MKGKQGGARFLKLLATFLWAGQLCKAWADLDRIQLPYTQTPAPLFIAQTAFALTGRVDVCHVGVGIGDGSAASETERRC